MKPYRKNIMMLCHTFPPFGSVGGSIRIVKFLKYMDTLAPFIKPTVVTLRDDIELLNESKNSYFLFNEIPKDVRIIRTNTYELRKGRLYNSSRLESENSKSFEKAVKSLSKKILKGCLHRGANYAYRNLLIPDPAILWRKQLYKEASNLLRKNHFDLLYATAPPFSVLITAAKLKNKFQNIPLILDIKDDWINNYYFRNKSRKVQQKELLLERFCVEAADIVILVTDWSLKSFTQRYPDAQKKMRLITNGCDISEHIGFSSKFKRRNDKFCILHSGVLTHSRRLKDFFKAMKELLACENCLREKLEIIFVGGLPEYNRREAINYGVMSNVKILDYLPREKYLETIFQADLLLVVNYDVPSLIPGKLYEYWATGNPILLLDSNSAASDLVVQYNLGKVANPSKFQEILEAVKYFIDKWERFEDCRIDDSGLKKFDRKQLTTQLIEIINEVTK